jgi:hypothetical protein
LGTKLEGEWAIKSLILQPFFTKAIEIARHDYFHETGYQITDILITTVRRLTKVAIIFKKRTTVNTAISKFRKNTNLHLKAKWLP